eukprot:2191335-Alexandrium_andersonii.AAC.1
MGAGMSGARATGCAACATDGSPCLAPAGARWSSSKRSFGSLGAGGFGAAWMPTDTLAGLA